MSTSSATGWRISMLSIDSRTLSRMPYGIICSTGPAARGIRPGGGRAVEIQQRGRFPELGNLRSRSVAHELLAGVRSRSHHLTLCTCAAGLAGWSVNPATRRGSRRGAGCRSCVPPLQYPTPLRQLMGNTQPPHSATLAHAAYATLKAVRLPADEKTWERGFGGSAAGTVLAAWLLGCFAGVIAPCWARRRVPGWWDGRLYLASNSAMVVALYQVG